MVPELDLEVWVSTALRLSPEPTEMYAEKSLALARELFGVTGHAPAKLPRRPAWCVTIDHGGTIPPGRKHTFPCQATDLEGADEPPDGAITTVRWSLKSEP